MVENHSSRTPEDKKEISEHNNKTKAITKTKK